MKNKRIIYIVISVIIGIGTSNGMVTNSNQSAEYIRMMNRNASTGLDAVLYNPAGLTHLNDGMYLYVSNQTIWQTRTVTAYLRKYNEDTYSGETFVPSFPNAYFAKKSGDMVYFAGFMPIGGGGSAEFPDGLPSFDYELAKYIGLPSGTSFGKITGYELDASFTGSSIYLAGQAGIAYSLNKHFSLAVGGRYVFAQNTYEGYLKDVILHAENGNIVGFIPDMEVDSKKTGSGYTAIIGLHLAPVNGLDIGFRYEAITKLQVVSDTKKDGTKGVIDSTGMFPDGVTYNEDIPSQISTGISYNWSDKLRTEMSFSYYMNTLCNWDGDEDKVTNDFDAGLGIEYAVSDKMKASIGYLYSTSGATERYNTDLDYGLDSQTIGLGGVYSLMPNFNVTLATSNTFYATGQNDEIKSKNFDYQEFDKTAFVIAFGIQYKIR